MLASSALVYLMLSPLAAAEVLAQSASLEDVEGLLRTGVVPKTILELVKKDCRGFLLDEESTVRLRSAGATDTFIARLGDVCLDPTLELALAMQEVEQSNAHSDAVEFPPPPPPPPPPAPASAGPSELFAGWRLELPVAESQDGARGFASLEMMTRSGRGWRVGAGAATSLVLRKDEPTTVVLRLDARVSYSILQVSERLELQSYGTAGTLFAVDSPAPGGRLSAGLAMDLGARVRVYADLAHEWRPTDLPLEAQSTLLSFGLSFRFSSRP